MKKNNQGERRWTKKKMKGRSTNKGRKKIEEEEGRIIIKKGR
jgi:hypothetical protein